MKKTLKKLIVVSLLAIFLINFIIAFVIFPEIGEKILYGKHPPGKQTEILDYSEIILSGDFECLESSSAKADGNLEEFVKEFNKCHN